jgi:hypothetical protein
MEVPMGERRVFQGASDGVQVELVVRTKQPYLANANFEVREPIATTDAVPLPAPLRTQARSVTRPIPLVQAFTRAGDDTSGDPHSTTPIVINFSGDPLKDETLKDASFDFERLLPGMKSASIKVGRLRLMP